MGVQETLDQIGGVLTRLEIPYERRADGLGYVVNENTVAVYVSVGQWGDGTAVHFGASVVEELELTEPDSIAKAHAAANRLNRTRYFARFCVYEERGTIEIEYDLFGDDVQADELVRALISVAELADQSAAELVGEVGGKRPAMPAPATTESAVTET